MGRGNASKDGELGLYNRGKETQKANLSPENSLGAMESLEPTLCSLDRRAEDEHREIERQEKALVDYLAELGRRFEHEESVKQVSVPYVPVKLSAPQDRQRRILWACLSRAGSGEKLASTTRPIRRKRRTPPGGRSRAMGRQFVEMS